MDGINYSIYILSLGNGSVSIKIDPLLSEYNLISGRNYAFDTNRDGQQDTNISFSGINNNKVNLSIALIYQFTQDNSDEDLSDSGVSIITDDGSSMGVNSSNSGSQGSSGTSSEGQWSLSTTTIWVLIVGIFVLLIIIAVAWFMKTSKQNIKSKKDEDAPSSPQLIQKRPPMPPQSRNPNIFSRPMKRF